jgi:hypothetical protein
MNASSGSGEWPRRSVIVSIVAGRYEPQECEGSAERSENDSYCSKLSCMIAYAIRPAALPTPDFNLFLGENNQPSASFER